MSSGQSPSPLHRSEHMPPPQFLSRQQYPSAQSSSTLQSAPRSSPQPPAKQSASANARTTIFDVMTPPQFGMSWMHSYVTPLSSVSQMLPPSQQSLSGSHASPMVR